MNEIKLIRRCAATHTVSDAVLVDSVLSMREVQDIIEKDYLLPKLPEHVEYIVVEWEYEPKWQAWTCTAHGYERIAQLNEVPREIYEEQIGWRN